jgi:hypothetical protein
MSPDIHPHIVPINQMKVWMMTLKYNNEKKKWLRNREAGLNRNHLQQTRTKNPRGRSSEAMIFSLT